MLVGRFSLSSLGAVTRVSSGSVVLVAAQVVETVAVAEGETVAGKMLLVVGETVGETGKVVEFGTAGVLARWHGRCRLLVATGGQGFGK